MLVDGSDKSNVDKASEIFEKLIKLKSLQENSFLILIDNSDPEKEFTSNKDINEKFKLDNYPLRQFFLSEIKTDDFDSYKKGLELIVNLNN